MAPIWWIVMQIQKHLIFIKALNEIRFFGINYCVSLGLAAGIATEFYFPCVSSTVMFGSLILKGLA